MLILLLLAISSSSSVIVQKNKRVYYCENKCEFYNTDFPDNDLKPYSKAKTLEDCKRDCLRRKKCLGLVFRSRENECWLKKNFGDKETDEEQQDVVAILRHCLKKKKPEKGGDQTSLSYYSEKRDFKIGFAVDPIFEQYDKRYIDIVLKHSNIITDTWGAKLNSFAYDLNKYDFTLPDKVYSLTNDKIKYRWHTLIWYLSLPNWFQNKVNKYNFEEVIGNIFKTVWNRYKKNTIYIDVVNEILSDNQKEGDKYTLRRDDNLYPRLGADFYKKAFKIAKQVVGNSKVKLVLLDYGTANNVDKSVWMYKKANAFYNLVKEMVDENIPLDAVGFQLHLNERDGPQIANGLKESFTKYIKLGLEIHVCEMDVAYGNFVSGRFVPGTNYNNDIKERQRYTYEKVIKTCLELPACSVVQYWSVADVSEASWLDPKSYPAMFDSNFKPKDSFWSVLNVLKKK